MEFSDSLLQSEKTVFGKICKRGHEYKDSGLNLRWEKSRRCILCERIKLKNNGYRHQVNWAENNPSRVKYRREVAQKYYRNMGLEGKIGRMLSNTKRRAFQKGLEFDLTKEWVLANLPKKCPVLGSTLVFGIGKGVISNPNSVSIDRFDNSEGYTQRNCRIISRRANVLKSDATIEELEAVLAYMKS